MQLKFLLMSKRCPHLKFVQTLSKLQILITFKDLVGHSLDKPSIFMSNPCPFKPFLDRVLTDLVVILDRVRTGLVLGQTLDRVMTELGQRLDFLSNRCPRFV